MGMWTRKWDSSLIYLTGSKMVGIIREFVNVRMRRRATEVLLIANT